MSGLRVQLSYNAAVQISFLVFILVIIVVTAAALALLGVLPLDTAGPAAAEGRLQGEINVLLGIQADNERRNIHNLNSRLKIILVDLMAEKNFTHDN